MVRGGAAHPRIDADAPQLLEDFDG